MKDGARTTTQIVTELGDHAGAWDQLVDAMPLPSPFLRSWWLAHVAEGEPCIVLVLDTDELIGGLALQRTTRAGVEWLQFLGSGPLEPDHLDLVAAPHRRADVVAAIRAWLARPGDRVIDLIGARAAALALDAVPGWGEVTALEVAPYVDLPATAAEYLASRGGRTRSTVSRTAKRLTRSGIEFRTVDERANATTVDEALDALRLLHDERWGDESGFLEMWARFSAAARAGVAAGEFRFGELADVDGKVVAIEADFVVAGRMSFYQAGRSTDHDLRGSGSVLRARIVESAIDAGCTEFDLLRGGEDYKTEWADRRRGLIRIRRGVGPRGRAVVAAARVNVAVQGWRQRGKESEPGALPDEQHTSVVLYTDAAQIGGAESVAKTLLAELAPRFDVTVMGTTREVVDDIASVRLSATTSVLAPIDNKTDVMAMIAHRRALRRLRPDVFHANLSEGSSCQYALLAAISIPGLRVVVTENSPMGVRSELSRRIKRLSARRFDAHIGVGTRAARLVEEDVGLPAGSVEVIPNAVPIFDHPPRRGHGGPPEIVAVSRFDPVKGLDVLLRALPLVERAAIDGGRLTVFGDGPERDALERLVSELGIGDRVEFAGWVSDVRTRLVDFDLFVLPSRLEGLPMSLLEAMHAGVAVVATDVGSVSEVVTDGMSGRVVPPDDPVALAAAISAVLSDDVARKSMAAEGRRVALEQFSSAAKVAAYEAVYARVTGK